MTNPKKGEENLKGTLVAVFGVLAVMILMWAACFNLFLDRF